MIRRLTVTDLSLLEAFFTSLVIGLAETYFPAFSLMKGASSIQAGLLISAPLLFAVFFQWLLLKKFRHLNLSTWVPLAAGLQLLALFGLTVISLIWVRHPMWVLMSLYSLYWAGYYSALPAWNRWITDLVPADASQKYFARRTRFIQVGILTGLILGGCVLHFNQLDVSAAYLFAALFSVCALFKFITYKLFRNHTRSLSTLNFESRKAFVLLKKHRSFFTRYTVYNAAVYLSAPFVASYLLSVRHVSYDQFMWVMIGLFSGKIIFTILFSMLKKEFSPFLLLFYGALFAAPLPIFWRYCETVPQMFLLHFMSGLGLACWELGLSLTFFKSIQSDEKIEIISLFYFFNVTSQVFGTAVGALLLKFVTFENYEMLFVIAGIFRFLLAFGLKGSKTFSNDHRAN